LVERYRVALEEVLGTEDDFLVHDLLAVGARIHADRL
jgi:hypothetical protein